jgi:hypothetical protein
MIKIDQMGKIRSRNRQLGVLCSNTSILDLYNKLNECVGIGRSLGAVHSPKLEAHVSER